MKLTAVILSMLFSTQVFSQKNYFTERCHFNSIQGEMSLYKKYYWEGHHMTLISDVEGIDDYPSVYLKTPEASEAEIDPVTGHEVMVLSIVRELKKIVVPYSDGCWNGQNTELDRMVKIDEIIPHAEDILGMKKGDELQLKCFYEHLEMTDRPCD